MSVAVTYTLIVAAFLAVFAMCMEISVRKRGSQQPQRWLHDGRRIDQASPIPRARPVRRRRPSILSR